jgi:heme/copper-type cytochrome/quinol oxidase subunit 4
MKIMISAGDMKAPQPVTKRLLAVALVTAFILLVPFVAMQFTSEMNWDRSDFVFAGTLTAATGLLYVLLTRKPSTTRQRVIVGGVLLLAFLIIWAEAAVGIFH